LEPVRRLLQQQVPGDGQLGSICLNTMLAAAGITFFMHPHPVPLAGRLWKVLIARAGILFVDHNLTNTHRGSCQTGVWFAGVAAASTSACQRWHAVATGLHNWPTQLMSLHGRCAHCTAGCTNEALPCRQPGCDQRLTIHQSLNIRRCCFLFRCHSSHSSSPAVHNQRSQLSAAKSSSSRDLH